MRNIKRNGIMPSDMNTILSGVAPGTITKDGMEPIHQRHYNQGRDFKKLEYKYNNELDDVFKKLREHGYVVSVNPNYNDIDLLNVRINDTTFSNYNGLTIECNDVEDVDDLLTQIQNIEYKNKDNKLGKFASDVRYIINK